MQPFASKAKLCSPAITNGAPPSMGTGWLDSFLQACSGCQIDCIAIHIYDSATNTAYYQSYIQGIGTKYQKPVWVTEVGRSCAETPSCFNQCELVRRIGYLTAARSFHENYVAFPRRSQLRPALLILHGRPGYPR